MRISMHQYQDDWYWHREQRACCDIRRVCTYVAIILSQLRSAVHERTHFIIMTALLAVTCVGTESCSQVIRCIAFSTIFFLMKGSRCGEFVCQFLSILYNVEVSTVMRNLLHFWSESDVRTLGPGCPGYLV
jgi:hypothetical protein